MNELKEAIRQNGGVPVQTRLPLPSLGLRVSERKLLLLLMDLFLINGSLIVALLLFTDLIPNLRQLIAWAKWFVTLTAVWVIFAVIFDAYDLARAGSGTYSLRAVVPAAGLTTIFYTGIPWLTPTIQNRSQVFAFIIFGVSTIAIWRYLYARLFVQPAFQQRALVVGAGSSGRALAAALQSDDAQRDANPFRGTGYQLLGFVDDDRELHDLDVSGVPVLGSTDRLVSLARWLQVDEIIVSITHAHQIRPELFEAILDCREMGIPITTMPTVYERLTGRVAVEHASRNVETAAGKRDGAFHRVYVLFKRVIDVLCGLIGMLALAIVTPLVALANHYWSPGPLLFRQERVGYAGHPFTVLKFRSMVPDAEKLTGARWAGKEDDRVTSFGRWLRKTHLDELPQVINVLRGEMSVVGPRPERPQFVAQLSYTIPFYRARHAVRPGITGWAQIHQDYGDSIEGAREKLEYDLYYVKNATALLDTLIMLRTVSKVLGLRGR